MLINNTVLGNAPFRTALITSSLFLTLLFTLMEPASSQGLSFFPRLLFWLLQVGTGMIGIVVASLCVRLIASRDFHIITLLSITGAVGTLLASPAFLVIEMWFPGLQEVPDGWLDEFALTGPFQALVAEFAEVLPVLLTVWYVVNLPLILKATYVNRPPIEAPAETSKADEQEQMFKTQFYAKLPTVIGKDIVSISSDLHYLNVTTTSGSSLVLGSLTQLANAFENEGFIVHRSHWVHKDHVVKIHIAGSQAFCIMSNDTQIPVSRSKRKLIKSYFGQTANSLVKAEPARLKQVE